ncbi:tripartite tricarboxylate transporter TctB family protein [Halorarum salinum]|uniref:Tripartite tricarboxylate transporter TctB family protein n=1 Tax=Halorarum salinum TaxID=2743089 RepID=A0A7D5LD77_9EURY|nr:tripartite tricarboxylate transporter TctB family protein [Halobaculum salinum]QLG63851.1 tripartite tricarboxylate transporter TctB family protein [Halobaculum salinum]
MTVRSRVANITPEHVMLVSLMVLGTVFYVIPDLEDYSRNASIFPQYTGAIVVVGAALLLVGSYLPGPIRSFVVEEVSITSGETTKEFMDEKEKRTEEVEEKEDVRRETLGTDYGFHVNDTVVMMVLSTLYLAAGYAAGMLYVTPLFVVAYTQWFKVRWWLSLLLAALATAIIYLFIEYLLIPFDQGQYVFTQGLL